MWQCLVSEVWSKLALNLGCSGKGVFVLMSPFQGVAFTCECLGTLMLMVCHSIIGALHHLLSPQILPCTFSQHCFQHAVLQETTVKALTSHCGFSHQIIWRALRYQPLYKYKHRFSTLQNLERAHPFYIRRDQVKGVLEETGHFSYWPSTGNSPFNCL